MSEQKITKLGIMVDTETLSLGSNAVVTQLAFVAFDREDPETIVRYDEEYLPIDPQLKPLSRQISGRTVVWWMKQSDAARAMFEQNDGTDFAELSALCQAWASKMSQTSERVLAVGGDVEVYARGPQFDVSIIESLLQQLAIDVPWKYDRVFDLRTVMNEAGVSKSDVPMRPGLVAHHALSDCYYQIDCLVEAWRRLRAAK